MRLQGGNYASLDGNLMIKALEMLTGDFVCMFRLGDTRVRRGEGSGVDQRSAGRGSEVDGKDVSTRRQAGRQWALARVRGHNGDQPRGPIG